MGEETGVIADGSTTPRIFRKEERLPAGVLKLTAEVPIAGLIAVGRPFIDHPESYRSSRQLRLPTESHADGIFVVDRSAFTALIP